MLTKAAILRSCAIARSPPCFFFFMSGLLLEINIQHSPDDYFGGGWQIANRVINHNDPASMLALASQLELATDRRVARSSSNGPVQTGQWEVMRDEVLNRPYLNFELPNGVTRALVTRLRRSADGLQSQLNRYFASGMELQLNRAS